MLPDSSKLFHCGNNGRWNACQMVRLNALWRKITMIYWSLSTQESCVMSRCHFRDDYYLSIRINSLICDFSVSFFFFFSFSFCPISPAAHPEQIRPSRICIPLRRATLSSGHVSIPLFICFSRIPGVSSDPALHPDLYPRWSHEADHPAGPEPAPAAVRTEELRVHLPHPGQHAQRPGPEVQQHQHTVSEDHGEARHIITVAYRGEIHCNAC